jgi:hypothetical protein
MQTTIERIQNHAERIGNGEIERVKPGMPLAFTAACVAGDAIRQGDLYLIIVDQVPSNYIAVKRPTKEDRQLVPGNTEGSRHCLDSLTGVKLFRPAKWDAESLEGPCMVLAKNRTILHPTHGQVLMPAGLTVICRYQREWDKEQQKQLRARD